MKTDSHEDIIAEHNLHQDGVRGPNVLRVEVTPPNGDFSTDSSEWKYRLDQDIMPAWHDAEKDETRARLALKDWIAARVIRAAAKRECRDGVFFAFDHSTVKAFDHSTITACDHSTVMAFDHSTVMAFDQSTVEAFDQSTVMARDQSTVEARDQSTVEAFGQSTVNQYSGAVKPPIENAVVIDRRNGKPIVVTA
jgi:hypothetical protein